MRKVTPQPILGRDKADSVLRLCREYSDSINQMADHRLTEYVSVSADYTAGENDHLILCSPSGAMTVTLPAASVMRNKRVVVKRANNTTHTVTIQSSSGTIDDAASVTLTTAYQSREVFSDGSEWWLLDVDASPETDPYWADVLFYCPMSANFDDVSGYSRAFTANSDAVISSTFQLFGLDTGKFTTSDDYSQTTEVTDISTIGANDFTFEFWIYLPATNGAFARQIFRILVPSVSSTISMVASVNSSDQIDFIASTGSAQIGVMQTSALSTGAWHHIAFQREGNIAYQAVDGTVTSNGANSFTGTITTATVSGVMFGNSTGTSATPPNCYMAHGRFTLNVARYTSNYDVPTGPFPTA